ncbi:MAG: ABC transporter substrate-binding protein [Xanthobacteraceae bacterium]|nr:ABC transporter substrate-binding protein [Xanthobacteraceae bacterium]
MKIDRRAFVGGLAVALVAPRDGFAASITDATGRTVMASDRLMRIYPAGPPAAVELYTLAPDLLMGWLEPIGQADREFLLPESAALPKIPRLTGRGGDTINLDALAALKPDLILDVSNTGEAYSSLAERVQQQSSIPYVLLDGHLDRIGATYRAIGHLIGRSEQAETLARYAETTIATITQRSAEVPSDARPLVYYARDKSGLQTGFGGSMISEPIEFIGARNAAAELHGAHGVATLEQVTAWNPEIIIAGDREFTKLVRSDPAWAAIAAVEKGRIYLAPRLPFGWIDYPPAVNRLIGLWWLAKIFYPDRFPEDINALARHFYTVFYHVTPTAAQIGRVLAGGD